MDICSLIPAQTARTFFPKQFQQHMQKLACPGGLNETDSTSLSGEARLEAANERATQGWNQLNGAFASLPENEKREIGQSIDARMDAWRAGLPPGTVPSQAQSNETLWMTMADVSATWAEQQAQAGLDSGNFYLARANQLNDLARGGQQYVEARGEYLELGGPAGQ